MYYIKLHENCHKTNNGNIYPNMNIRICDDVLMRISILYQCVGTHICIHTLRLLIFRVRNGDEDKSKAAGGSECSCAGAWTHLQYSCGAVSAQLERSWGAVWAQLRSTAAQLGHNSLRMAPLEKCAGHWINVWATKQNPTFCRSPTKCLSDR